MCFDTSIGNQLPCFQNGYFFKILWWFHEAHNWVNSRWKNKYFFQLFINEKFITLLWHSFRIRVYSSETTDIYETLWTRLSIIGFSGPTAALFLFKFLNLDLVDWQLWDLLNCNFPGSFLTVKTFPIVLHTGHFLSNHVFVMSFRRNLN